MDIVLSLESGVRLIFTNGMIWDGFFSSLVGGERGKGEFVMGRPLLLLLGLLSLAVVHAGCLPMAVAVPLAVAQTAGMVVWHTRDNSSEEVASLKEKPSSQGKLSSNKRSRYAAVARSSARKPIPNRVLLRQSNTSPQPPLDTSEEVAGQIF